MSAGARMSVAAAWHRARLAAGLVSHLRDPLDPSEALPRVRAGVASRETRFLENARTSIFENRESVHRELLAWAGWPFERLRDAILAEGLEPTLERLRDDGVSTSLAELRSGEPIRRDGLLLPVDGAALDEPRLRPGAVAASTSGTSSGTPTRVAYDWALFREEAELECLLFKTHDVLDVPWAMWLPALPSISGIHNLFVHLRFRHPPARWFSQLPQERLHTAALRYVQAVARANGLRSPIPEATSFSNAGVVARWLADARDRTGRAVLKTFASSAVRVVESARDQQLDLTGCVFFAGGEPLTDRRTDYIRSSGARVYARYVATESGWIAGACQFADAANQMHVYTNRLAVISDPGGHLLYTTISPGSGKVLLNTDLGDAGRLSSQACGCLFGAAGLDVRLADVAGHDKVSADGMTLPVSALRAELGALVADAGGSPDSYDLFEQEDETGQVRLVVMLSPTLAHLDERELAAALIRRLPGQGPGAALAARFWQDSEAVEVRREHPALTGAMKRRLR